MANWYVVHSPRLPQEDMSLRGYKKYLVAEAAPLPLTAAEEELRRIKLSEVRTHTHAERTVFTLPVMFKSNSV